ncbi:hypothetical protein [Deinococcus sonorensis]|uniref:Uncharacterized protein n=2 Tax=Deinococcus sonorensis TaxID=309891 RepID=A0AAU7U8N0_9DEIO
MTERSTHLMNGPRNSVYGIFSELEEVRDFSQRLLDLGLAESQVRVLIGEAGIRELDHDGRYSGVLARFRRLLQGMTDERDNIERYLWALASGHIVVSVALPARQDHAPVCAAFKACNAHFVHYYGAWVVHQFSA